MTYFEAPARARERLRATGVAHVGLLGEPLPAVVERILDGRHRRTTGSLCRSASSANLHSAFTRRIWSTLLQRAQRSCREHTTTDSAWARDTATLRRLRLNRKS